MSEIPVPEMSSSQEFHESSVGIESEFVVKENYEKDVEDGEEEEEEFDPYKLRSLYDVVLLGTGLVESLVASAAAKHRQKVLHLDVTNNYGDAGASFSLNSLHDSLAVSRQEMAEVPEPTSTVTDLEFALPSTLVNGSPRAATNDSFNASQIAQRFVSETPLPQRVTSTKSTHLHPAFLSLCTSSRGSGVGDESLRVVGGSCDPNPLPIHDSTCSHPAFHSLKTPESRYTLQLAQRERDVTASFVAKGLFAGGEMVDALVNSGVCQYMEFKPTEAMYFLLPTEEPSLGSSVASAAGDAVAAIGSRFRRTTGTTIRRVGAASVSATGKPPSTTTANPILPVPAKAGAETTGTGGALWTVPCSKNGIFASTVLSVLEKRALMKFQLFVADWSRQQAGSDVTSLNERELATGRSLHRPQNKAAANAATVFEDNELARQTLDQLLETFGLSSKLRGVVAYIFCLSVVAVDRRQLCLEDGKAQGLQQWTALDALRDFSAHVLSLGRFGDTAFLNCMYGDAEMTQGFCRVAAVWGALYILRRTLSSLEVPVASSTEKDEGSKCVSLRDSEGNSFRARSLVVNCAYLPTSRCQSVVSLQQIAIYAGLILPQGRSRAVLPPKFEYINNLGERISVGNQHAVHIAQVDDSSFCTPRGTSLLTINTLVDDADWTFNSNDTFRDWNSRVANLDCTQLSTSIRIALEHVVGATHKTLYAASVLAPVFDVKRTQQEVSSKIPGVYCTAAFDYTTMHYDTELEAAKTVFGSICPGLPLFEKDLAAVENAEAEAEDMEAQEFADMYRMVAETEKTDANEDSVQEVSAE